MRTPLAACAVLTAASLLVGCGPSGSETDQSDTSDPRAITVESSADACEFSATDAPTGTLTFAVKNTGTAVTEFYLLGEDGLRVVAVVENIGPGIERALTVDAPAGGYVTVCKPGLAGEGIRGDFTVTGPDQVAADTDDGELVEQAEAGYGAYVEDQSAQLLEKTRTFLGLYRAGIPEVFAVADAMQARFRMLVLLATFCSMRWGELAALTRGDIDSDTGSCVSGEAWRR